MFIGRESELSWLDGLYRKDDFQFVVLYGRRRVGKTAVISEFLQGKKSIFFSAQQYDDKTALKLFSEKVYSCFGIDDVPVFENWNQAFEFIANRVQKKRLTLVLDEFPYLAGANRSIPSILQNITDHRFKNSKLFLILCGSSMSFMERGVLSEKSPLYGRLTSQMEILPFSYFDAARFFPRYSLSDKVMAYGICGGVPQYLIHIKDSRSLGDNVVAAVLAKASPLYEEPKNLLKEELRTPVVYNSIIEAIAKGQTRLNDIATKTDIPRDKCLKYIRSLITLRLIERETPAGEKPGKRSIYKLTDNFFKFWYSFVFENTELVAQENGSYLWDKLIVPSFSEYLGYQIFEDICKAFLRRINGASFKGKHPPELELPFVFTQIGHWWGTDPKDKSQVEIDILACHKEKALFCECKWTNKMMGPDILTGLRKKAALLSQFSARHYILFSKSGFSSALKEAAKQGGDTILVDLKSLFSPY
jgi:AAA+ ATPase superfamily predicted ATPase